MWNENQRDSKRKREGFATVQLSTTEFFGKRDPDKKEVLSGRKTSQHASLLKWAIDQKRMPVITDIHLSVPFTGPGGAGLGVCVCLSIRKRLGANQRHELILW